MVLTIKKKESKMSKTLTTTQHKGYQTCNDCNGLVIDTETEWLGEDEDGRGRYIAHEECEECGKQRSSRHFE